MCFQKLETIAGHQTTGNGTCDCEWIFVAVTGVITVALGMGMAGDLQGSQKDIEKTLDTELLRSYAYWMGDEVIGQDDAAAALKNMMTEISFIHLSKRSRKEKKPNLSVETIPVP